MRDSFLGGLMDYRNILAFSILILTLGYTWSNFQAANAFPQGPNVSMGSNPINQAYKYCNALTNEAMLTNSSSQDFIVTDIIVTNGTADILIDGNTIINVSGHIAFQTGLKILSGSTVSCTDTGSYPRVTITGYYTHT
jgi:hypothetical protein